MTDIQVLPVLAPAASFPAEIAALLEGARNVTVALWLGGLHISVYHTGFPRFEEWTGEGHAVLSINLYAKPQNLKVFPVIEFRESHINTSVTLHSRMVKRYEVSNYNGNPDQMTVKMFIDDETYYEYTWDK